MRAACDWHASSRQHKKSPLKRLDTRSQGVSSFVNSVLRKIPVSTRVQRIRRCSSFGESPTVRDVSVESADTVDAGTRFNITRRRSLHACTPLHDAVGLSNEAHNPFPFFMKSRAKRSLLLNQCGNLSDCAPVEYRVIISSSIAFSRTHRPA